MNVKNELNVPPIKKKKDVQYMKHSNEKETFPGPGREQMLFWNLHAHHTGLRFGFLISQELSDTAGLSRLL
jgi:hypothetical protein